MTNPREVDQVLVSRFTDGRLNGQELAEFERRLLREPALRQAADEQREAQEWFARVRATEPARPRVPAGFAEGVVREARRLPARDGLRGEAAVLGEVELRERSALRTAKTLLAAAAVVFGLSLLVAGGVLRPGDGDLLSANPDRVRQIDRQMQEADRRDAEHR